MNTRRPHWTDILTDELPYFGVELDQRGDVAAVLFMATNHTIAKGAFDEAILQRPRSRMMLREGARIISIHDGCDR